MYIIIGVFFLTGLLFIGKLFYLQVINKKFILSAQNNVLRAVTQYPARGLIYDRNNKLLVINEAAYDLMIVPAQIKTFDTAEICALTGIERNELEERLERIRKYSMRKASVFEKQLPKETYAYLEEKLYKYPGFYVQSRTLRKYPDTIGAAFLGYVGEASPEVISNDSYYKSGDYIGISGLEKTYEEVLKGQKGVRRVLVDVYNREKGSFQNGRYDTAAVIGKDIQITIDAELQAYGEYLMRKKKGSIVAIEPSTGEILVMVTSPSYDPNLLVGNIRSKNYAHLQQDTLEPLFNRALTATYPPGSTFKIINAMIALQEGKITPYSEFSCNGTESVPIKCSHYHTTPLSLVRAIEISCNPYFWQTFRLLFPGDEDIHKNFNTWRAHVLSFGYGKRFNSDLFNEGSGFIPEPSYFDKYFGKTGWRAMTIRSLAIGQGEILVTPLQLANLAATISNRGYYYTPHLIRSIEGEEIPEKFKIRQQTSIDRLNFEYVVEGMYKAFEGPEGTARWYKVDSLEMCGKTGTAENPHGKDHSIFIGFAPKDNPRIAISVIVENAGFGATWAVPIATLVIEKYLKGEISRKWIEERMVNQNLL